MLILNIMIETKVPKDIRSYETKIIGPFTMRQTIAIGIMVLVDILLFLWVLRPMKVSANAMVYVLMFFDIPVAAFGFIKVMGMPLEKYLRSYIIYTLLAPAKRGEEPVFIKKTDLLKAPAETGSSKKKKPLSKKDLAEHPEYRPYL